MSAKDASNPSVNDYGCSIFKKRLEDLCTNGKLKERRAEKLRASLRAKMCKKEIDWIINIIKRHAV